MMFAMKSATVCAVAVIIFSVVIYAEGMNTKTLVTKTRVEDGQTPHVKNKDGSMIPDKYNTGPDPNANMTMVPASEPGSWFNYSHIKFYRGTSSYYSATSLLLDFFNFRDAPHSFTIENTNFSGFGIEFLNNHNLPGEWKIVFKNCVFGSFNGARVHNPNMTFEFYDSEFVSASGSYMIFERCLFHPKAGDAMNIFSDVLVKDSYIYIMGSTNTGTHMDGFQTFGKADYNTYNLAFKNLRIEFPKIRVRNVTDPSKWVYPYVNAPVMVQIEFSPEAYNYTLEDMHINGGGYSMYWHCVSKCQILRNNLVKNVQVGYGHMFGILYPKHENVDDDTNVFEGLEHVTLPYIGSAWKTSTGAHVSLTNELLTNRTMLCIADDNTNTTIFVPAHPKLTQKMDKADVPEFADLPYDMDVIVADKSAVIVSCYDVTETAELDEKNLIKTINFNMDTAVSVAVSWLFVLASVFFALLL